MKKSPDSIYEHIQYQTDQIPIHTVHHNTIDNTRDSKYYLQCPNNNTH